MCFSWHLTAVFTMSASNNNFEVDEEFSRKCADMLGGSVEHTPLTMSDEPIQPDPKTIEQIEENTYYDEVNAGYTRKSEIQEEYMEVRK
jgi:hypothetical protein